MPIGLIGSLVICTVFYLLVAAGAIGTVGAQPVTGARRRKFSHPGSTELAARCQDRSLRRTRCRSFAPRKHWRTFCKVGGYDWAGYLIGLAAGLALPSVILMMLFGQTRIFFVMARDGLLPEKLATIHPKWKTPHIVTMITGVVVAVAAAFLPVGKLADISNSGTLFAFFMVALAVMILRRTDPGRKRPFRTPLVWVVAPLAAAGCLGLFCNLPLDAKLVLPIWGGIGLVIYFSYGYRKSHVGRGIVDVHEDDVDAPPQPVPPID